MKHKGLLTHRFKENPEEERFAKAWDKYCEQGHLLDHLLDTRPIHQGHPPPVSDRDEAVAATIVQWLGSPVGQGFLEDMGYVRKP